MNWICRIFRGKKKNKVKFQWENNLPEWSKFEQELCAEINLYRLENGLPFLKPDRFCREQTKLRTYYCIYKEQITHEQMGLVQQNAEKAGLKHYKENLAYGYTNAQSTLQAWIRSKPHNTTLLHKDSIYFGVYSELDENLKRYTTLGLFR